MEGVFVLAVALAGALAFGLWRRRSEGRVVAHPAGDQVRLTSEDLGHALGERATFVQFSTTFCQPCRANRQVLGHVARTDPGVVHVDIDAESHLELVRRLGVTRTPTTFVLDATGSIRNRAFGALRLEQARSAVQRVTEP